jgi:hypothetical protein
MSLLKKYFAKFFYPVTGYHNFYRKGFCDSFFFITNIFLKLLFYSIFYHIVSQQLRDRFREACMIFFLLLRQLVRRTEQDTGPLVINLLVLGAVYISVYFLSGRSCATCTRAGKGCGIRLAGAPFPPSTIPSILLNCWASSGRNRAR